MKNTEALVSQGFGVGAAPCRAALKITIANQKVKVKGPLSGKS